MKPSTSALLTLTTCLASATFATGCSHSNPPPRITRTIITPPPVIVGVPAEKPAPVVVETTPAAPAPTTPPPIPAPTPQSASEVAATPPAYAQRPPQSQAAATALATQTVIVEERPAVTTQVFYNELSPYGTWIHMNNYGWVWQPTAATVNVNWRPYYDRGHWIYTDAGWYWHSDYPWGWAPFHYGRWSLEAEHGWVWVPGIVWAPSWVSFRYTDAHCGWAPLPPYVDYSVGVGFTYHGSRVSVGFGFGLSHHHYAFVDRHYFGHRHHRHHGVDHTQAKQVFNNSTVINNYIVGDNNTIINEGISCDRLASGNTSEVRRVPLRDVADARHATENPRTGNQGEAIPVYRPKVTSDKSEPTDRQLARQEIRATRNKIQEHAKRRNKPEPSVRRNAVGASSRASLAAQTKSTSGLITPRRTGRTATSHGQKQSVAKPTSRGRIESRPSRETATTQRSQATRAPQRPTSTSPSSRTTASKNSGLTKQSVHQHNTHVTTRSEVSSNRSNARTTPQGRIETRKRAATANTNRARASIRPNRTTITPNRSYTATSRSEISANRSNTRTVNNGFTRMPQQPSQSQTTITSQPTQWPNTYAPNRSTTPQHRTSRPIVQQTPRTTVQASPRRSPSSPRQTMSPSHRRSPPIQNRSYAPPRVQRPTASSSVNRAPVISRPPTSRSQSSVRSYSRPAASRSSALSRSDPSRSTPQRSRSVPSR
ncbi:MAG: hypothetical protein M2R45_01668 [Verrucomicrobia subdivision 3 bacterium]|nr:hypothetical protein [Limisphaerales bacterium]MCS1412819.1 hypothetical protein [Limisphaerales bacterium]